MWIILILVFVVVLVRIILWIILIPIFGVILVRIIILIMLILILLFAQCGHGNACGPNFAITGVVISCC